MHTIEMLKLLQHLRKSAHTLENILLFNVLERIELLQELGVRFEYVEDSEKLLPKNFRDSESIADIVFLNISPEFISLHISVNNSERGEWVSYYSTPLPGNVLNQGLTKAGLKKLLDVNRKKMK